MGTTVRGRSTLDIVGSVFQSIGIPIDSILVGTSFKLVPQKTKTRYKITLEFEPPSVPVATRHKTQKALARDKARAAAHQQRLQSKTLADPRPDQTAQQPVSSSGPFHQPVIRLDEKSNGSSHPDRASASNEQVIQLTDSSSARAELGNPSSAPSAPTYKQVAAAQSKPITDSVNTGSALALQDNDLQMNIGSSDGLLVKTKKRTRGSKPAATTSATTPPSQEGGLNRKVALVPTADGVLSRQIVKPWCSRNMLEGPSESIHIRQGSGLFSDIHVVLKSSDGLGCITKSATATWFHLKKDPSTEDDTAEPFHSWAVGLSRSPCKSHSRCISNINKLFSFFGKEIIFCNYM